MNECYCCPGVLSRLCFLHRPCFSFRVKRGIFLGSNKNPNSPTNTWLYSLGLPQRHKLCFNSICLSQITWACCL